MGAAKHSGQRAANFEPHERRSCLMRIVLAVVVALTCSSAFAEARSTHARLLEKYEEPDNWKNRSNFYVGLRGGIAIPSGANNLAPSVGLELGVAPDFGFGFGLHVIWMNHPPGAPVFGIPEGQYGFGAMADVRFYFPTIEPLTLYPSLSVGFLAGPALDGKNMVLPLFNPGIGAKVKFGDFYGSFEFGFAGLSIPFVTVGFGYEGDRRERRAEAWARDQEEAARERGEEVDLSLKKKVKAPATVKAPAPAAAPELSSPPLKADD